MQESRRSVKGKHRRGDLSHFSFDTSPVCQWHRLRQHQPHFMKKLLLPMLTLALAATALAAEKDSRAFELRVYYAAPGKLDDLHARFRNHTLKLFEKHGMANLGYWVPLENPDNKLIYVVAHASRDAAKKSWKDFGGNPDWKAAQKASEVNGRLVAKVESTYLSATDYSAAIGPSAAQTPRTFELRTYKTPPGKLAALNARFRDHTLGLFSKHGMTHFGYWTPMDADKGADDTLIYILAHKSKEAAEASFKSFRADSQWIAAKAASEKDGALTLPDGVKSVFMKATDYSPTK
jgi:hypothetical protein